MAYVSNRSQAYRLAHRERVDRRRADQDRTDSRQAQPEEPDAMRVSNDDIIDHPTVIEQKDSTVRWLHWYSCRTMAKAKRRKLRARRSKANHGRKPNAGRG